MHKFIVCVRTINVELEINHQTIYGSTDESLWHPHINLPVIQHNNIVHICLVSKDWYNLRCLHSKCSESRGKYSSEKVVSFPGQLVLDTGINGGRKCCH